MCSFQPISFFFIYFFFRVSITTINAELKFIVQPENDRRNEVLPHFFDSFLYYFWMWRIYILLQSCIGLWLWKFKKKIRQIHIRIPCNYCCMTAFVCTFAYACRLAISLPLTLRHANTPLACCDTQFQGNTIDIYWYINCLLISCNWLFMYFIFSSLWIRSNRQ